MLLSRCWLVAGVIQLLLLSSGVHALEDSNAQALFANHGGSVFQIQVIDNAANNKSSTGTGFLVDASGLIATNYHVIASEVDLPEKYRVELLVGEDEVVLATVLNVDVVNDLALLQVDQLRAAPVLELAAAESLKGDTVYSIGFPYDLGITVVPGTYNGLAPHSANKRVHFTGSLNPGMSGGPAFNSAGEVIGVNVSTAGNQMSFLVPVTDLRALLDTTMPGNDPDFDEIVAAQLKRNSKRMIDEMLAGDWSTVPLGGAHGLDEVTGFLRCWGESKDQSNHDDKTPFWARRSCQTDHNIFLARNHSTGKVELQFYWIEAEDLNSIQFYNFYDRIFRRYRPGNRGDRQDLGNWACDTEFVRAEAAADGVTKAVFCARAYKQLPGLYDVLFLQGSVNDARSAHMIHFTIAGTTQELAREFTQRFMEAGVW